MILVLKNIGKIKEARVHLNGITVIAGENNTGKSTVGKVLYCVFNSFYKVEERMFNEKKSNIERTIFMMYRNSTNKIFINDIDEIAAKIVTNADEYKLNPELLKLELESFLIEFEEHYTGTEEQFSLEGIVARIMDIINISSDDILRTILSKNIDAEFNG